MLCHIADYFSNKQQPRHAEMATASPPSSSARALREFFGDRRPPSISRKITACVACRKLKIKCHMQDSNPPCTRCTKRRLPCTVNRSLQMLLESDITWKQVMEEKLGRVEEAIGKIADKISMPEVLDGLQVASVRAETVMEDVVSLEKDSDPVTDPQQPQVAWEVVMDAKCNPAAIPATCISEVSHSSTPSQLLSDSHQCDLISRGSVSLAAAERFFAIYHDRLDHFVYRILADRESLSSIRASSSLLTAAVCAVGALHAQCPEYEICYKELMKEYSSQMISKRHSLDDVRGLCIAAFWLSDMSWALAGAAVRIAIELNLHRGVTKTLHRCLTQTPAEQKLCYVRTRLYLLVYVCDHHFSILYGRSPMVREFTLLSAPRSFLDLEHATEDDVRLVAQVELWSIVSRIYDTFGVNTDIPIPQSLLSEFRRLGISLETWRADYSDKLAFSRHIGNYPKLGVSLHFHFARLYLCTHAFRGASGSETISVPAEMEEFADAAVYSAGFILRATATNEEIQSLLNGLPTYFDTMVASAVVFLLKMVVKSPGNTRINKTDTLDLLAQVADVLKNITSQMNAQHLLSQIAQSASRLVERFEYTIPQDKGFQVETLAVPGMDTVQSEVDWLGSEHSFFLGNYDLLYFQDGDFSLDEVETGQ
ncbi:hypothetical protein GQ53DRAFT_725202 [Thozetella sp. PMI_491]|nr:hypothetical protein GQ53DRAFT_725202 [Thozetella sp. PMI_491]